MKVIKEVLDVKTEVKFVVQQLKLKYSILSSWVDMCVCVQGNEDDENDEQCQIEKVRRKMKLVQ